jgi:[acyl-carrier-protein] S-malonyltransferase
MLAFLFPGQGSQFVGMGKGLMQSHPIARDTFDEADETLGRALSELCISGPADELTQTVNAQPAILATSVAAYRVLLAETGLRPTITAGHSLGEITAYVCAGALDFGTALQLVQQRGRFMQDAVPAGVGAMAAIMGMRSAAVAEICSAVAESDTVSVANYNGPNQAVVSGQAAAVDRVQREAERQGALTRSLDVSAPFHCSLMNPAAVRFAEQLEGIEFQAPLIPVIDCSSGELRRTREGLGELLAAQVSAPVRWDLVMNRLAALATWATVEIGPGKRLSSMIRRAEKSIRTAHVGDVSDLDTIRPMLAERPCLDRPLGDWRINDSGDLFAPRSSEIAWAGTDRVESATGESWTTRPDGVRFHRYGRMAVIDSDDELRTFDADAWYPREDGAYVRKDHTEILWPSGAMEHLDPDLWTLDRTGTLRRVDGSRIIWADGSEWRFAEN